MDLQLCGIWEPQVLFPLVVVHNRGHSFYCVDHVSIFAACRGFINTIYSDVSSSIRLDTGNLPRDSGDGLLQLSHLAYLQGNDNNRVLRKVNEEDWVRHLHL